MTQAHDTAFRLAQNIPDPDLRNQVLRNLAPDATWNDCVKAFHALYQAPDDTDLGTTAGVAHMTDDRLAMRLALIEEEFGELKVATKSRDEIEMADALSDIAYVVIGMALEMGVDLSPVISEVQASNMTKLGENGEVLRRPDGKILKGPLYVKPDIKAVLRYRD